MVGSEEGDNGGGDECSLVRTRASQGGCMQTVKAVYKRVKTLVGKKGGDIKSCCRSVAEQYHLEPGEVEVAIAGMDKEMYKKLGFDVRVKV